MNAILARQPKYLYLIGLLLFLMTENAFAYFYGGIFLMGSKNESPYYGYVQYYDSDLDSVPDLRDNCSRLHNPKQLDTDNDGMGNACDADDDNDGFLDYKDAFPLDPNRSKSLAYCGFNGVMTCENVRGNMICRDRHFDDPRCLKSTKEPHASKNTLLGIDSDRDGIRDDVKDSIEEKFGKNITVTNYTKDMAKRFQKILLGAPSNGGTLSHKQVNQQVAKIKHLDACIQNKTNANGAGLQFLLPEQLNTVARTRAYLKAAAEAYDAEGPPVVEDCGSSTKSLSSIKAFAATNNKGGGMLKGGSNNGVGIKKPNLNGYELFFINGVRNSEDQANESLDKLSGVLGIEPIKLEYNEDHLLGQLFDFWVHKVGESQVDKTGTLRFWLSLYFGVMKPDNAINETLSEWLNPYRAVGFWAEEDLARMIKTAITALNQKKKVIMVAHSEGNFFYRNIYNALKNWDRKKTEQCFAGVGVATPLSSKPGNYEYITNSNDIIINAVRRTWESTLPANVTVPFFLDDVLGHGMQETYLSHSKPVNLLKSEFKKAKDKLDKSCKTCEDSEMAIWVANDNNARDDNFDLYINDKFLSYLNLGTDNCNGHFILPKKYNQFDKHDLSFHEDVTKEINGCIGSLGEDHSSKAYFSDNLPITKASSKYKVKLINKKNNHNANYGKIYSFQICPNPENGKPVVRRILGSAAYSGYSGEDIDSFNFKTSKCLPCDDLGNTGNFPDNKVTVILKSGGRRYCTAKVKLNGEFKSSAYSTGYRSALRLMPGHYELELYDFSSSCQIGVTSSTVDLTVSLDQEKLAHVSFLFNKAYFVIPAVDNSNLP